MKIRTLSSYCKERFGTKVYRISLTAGYTCPNRDGKVGRGGCSFCSETGSGEFAAKEASIEKQIEIAKKLIDSKFPKQIEQKEKKYIAYFQSFTNTYGDTSYFKKIFEKVIKYEEIVAVSIATRPDCLEEDKIALLGELNKQKPIWVELGLQTTNEACAKKFNRGYSLDVFEKAYESLKKAHIEVIVHVILGLPYESIEDTMETITYLAAKKPRLDGIKLHLLNVLKGTRLEKEYREHPFPIMTMEEYTDLVVKCLKILPEEVVIHRMTGDGDRRVLVQPKWVTDKKKVLNLLNKKIQEADREIL